MLAILVLAVLLSSDRRAIRPRVVGAAFALQAGIALLVLHTGAGRAVIGAMSRGVSNLLGYAGAGTAFLFGPLAAPEVGGNSFAIAALPVIIFFASLVAVLYHLGAMQFVVRWVGGGIRVVTGITRVESLCAAANIFVGQSESPLVIRPYLASLSAPQLFTVMVVGMAGVAGTILAAYATLLGPSALPYLLAASFMAAPGGILMAKIIMPDPRGIAIVEPAALRPRHGGRARGQRHHGGRQWCGDRREAGRGGREPPCWPSWRWWHSPMGCWAGWARGSGCPTCRSSSVLGALFAPFLYLAGVPWEEAARAGGLFGTKLVLNEFVAFIELGGDARD